MQDDDPGPIYESPLPYEAVRIHAAAVYCSDGRIGEHMDDFLQQGLALPRYDRLTCPGGPVALAGRLLALWETRGVEDQLRFLVGVHDVKQVVLVAHAGCAYYQRRLGLEPVQAEKEQRADLRAAGAQVQRVDSAIEVAAFFAHVEGAQVWFERVFASPGIDGRLKRWRGAVRV
jgi:Putative carbonic anhydrase